MDMVTSHVRPFVYAFVASVVFGFGFGGFVMLVEAWTDRATYWGHLDGFMDHWVYFGSGAFVLVMFFYMLTWLSKHWH